jgi:hypothetical protein
MDGLSGRLGAPHPERPRPAFSGRILIYDAFKRPGLHGDCTGCTGAATSLRLGTVPRLRSGASSGGSVQIELSQEALMLRVLRDLRQAGRLERDGDLAHGQRPVRGVPPGRSRASAAAAWQQAPAPRGRGTGSRHPRRGTSWTGPAIPRPGPPRPGRTRPGTCLPVRRCPMCPRRPYSRSATFPPSALTAITIPALHASASPGALLTRAGRTPRSRRPR